MKKVFAFVLILVVSVQCKKDDFLSLAHIAPVVGEWRITAYTDTDGKTTVPDTTAQGRALLIEIRTDGVIVDGYGRQGCCPPSKYFFRDREFIPQPMAPIEPSICPFVLCASCPEVRISMPTLDTLLVKNCWGGTSTYVREK